MFSKEKYKVGHFLSAEDARTLLPHFYPTTILAEVAIRSLGERLADGTKTAEIIRNHGKSILVKVTDQNGDFVPIWYRETEDIIIPTDTFDTDIEPEFSSGQTPRRP